MNAIRSVELTRRFRHAVAVDHVDLRVREGTITAFLGPNGAGKTTTIRMLLGLLQPHGGSCEVLGLSPGHPRALASIGALVEQPSLYEHLTGLENLQITRLMKDVPRTDVDRVLDLVGLTLDARRHVRTYSLGMRQRLGVALALLGKPRLLILDEPNNGLDPEGIIEMRELMKALTRLEGVTVFLSSHLLAEVEQVASEVVVIHKGRLRYQGSMSEMGGAGTEEVRIRVDRPDAALALMKSRGFGTQLEEGGLVVQVPRGQVPEIAALVVGSGLELNELTPVRPNLEARFLRLLESV